MSCVLEPEPGMEIYGPTCGWGGLLVKCKIAMEEKLSRIVEHTELKKNDYNISPSRYIHTGETET